VRSGETIASVPLSAVRRSLHLSDADVARSGRGSAIALEGRPVPFVPLAALLGTRTARRAARRRWPAVVIQAGAGLAALGVDQLFGTADVVVHPVPDCAEAEPVVAGATLDADGNPQLVLDPAAVVAAAASTAGVAEEAPPPRLPILVVDDSLTTRMLEQSILESAGYRVELATSAEEALVKAREQRFGLFVVDVEMPGMDGFELVRTTRADPVLGQVPAILVTSRNAPEDRARGVAVGARAYIAKGEFDQGELLRLVHEAVG
jgi:two-component system chemotaxis sensor kinase CheA